MKHVRFSLLLGTLFICFTCGSLFGQFKWHGPENPFGPDKFAHLVLGNITTDEGSCLIERAGWAKDGRWYSFTGQTIVHAGYEVFNDGMRLHKKYPNEAASLPDFIAGTVGGLAAVYEVNVLYAIGGYVIGNLGYNLIKYDKLFPGGVEWKVINKQGEKDMPRSLSTWSGQNAVVLPWAVMTGLRNKYSRTTRLFLSSATIWGLEVANGYFRQELIIGSKHGFRMKDVYAGHGSLVLAYAYEYFVHRNDGIKNLAISPAGNGISLVYRF